MTSYGGRGKHDLRLARFNGVGLGFRV